MSENLCLQAAQTELSSAGIESQVEARGKHQAIVWQVGGERRHYIVPLSPSDHRAHLNVRSDVRRMLKADGLGAIDVEINAGDSPRLHLAHGAAFCTSLDVAAHFGKAHKNVLRDIDRILEDLGPEYGRLNFEPSSYLNQQGKSQRSFNLSRDGFTLLAMGFTGPEAIAWKVKYLDAFNRMEAELRQSVPAIPDDAMRRIEKLEGDLEALVDLTLSQPTPEPGYIIVKAYKRRTRRAVSA